MAYATIDELAYELNIKVTTANQAKLQACLDAAAIELDASMDRVDPIDPGDPLVNRANVLRAFQWYKAQDAAFGSIGAAVTGQLRAPTSTFNPTLVRARKQLFGVG